jgi:hypothetical protein
MFVNKALEAGQKRLKTLAFRSERIGKLVPAQLPDSGANLDGVFAACLWSAAIARQVNQSPSARREALKLSAIIPTLKYLFGSPPPKLCSRTQYESHH